MKSVRKDCLMSMMMVIECSFGGKGDVGEKILGEFYSRAKSQMAGDGIHQILFTLNFFWSPTIQSFIFDNHLQWKVILLHPSVKMSRLKPILELTFKYLTSFVRTGHYLLPEIESEIEFSSTLKWVDYWKCAVSNE